MSNATNNYGSQPRFRLVFTDPADLTPERAQQIFSTNYQDEASTKWVDAMLAAGGPESFVSIYQTAETLISYKKKPRPEPAK